jgi:Ca-activated chloride channel family protein
MQKLLITILFNLLIAVGYGQLQYEFTKYDFGEVDRETVRWVDLEITNKGKKDVYVLRVEADRSVQYRISNNVIAKDSVVFVRLFIDPFKTGDFKEEVSIWTSNKNEPQRIILKGEIKETNTLALQSCPDFGDVNPYKIAFELGVVVKDAANNPVENAKVVIARSSNEAYEGSTNKKGNIKVQRASIGLYRVQTKVDNKVVADEMVYFNRQNPYHTVILKQELIANNQPTVYRKTEEAKPSEKTVAKETKTVAVASKPVKKEEQPTGAQRVETDAPEKSTSLVDLAIEAELAKQDTITVSGNAIDDAIERELAAMEVKENETILMDSLEQVKNELELVSAANDPTDFSRLEYAPNNIVFLIDVSTSMRYLERIDLLKIAMIELTAKLRDIDYMSVVTYASAAKTRLEPTQGSNKASIDSLIWSLEASGTTASDKGLDQAYLVAEKTFISSGNNQIILVTDGAFDAKSLYRLIRKKAKEEIKLSVVGIKAEKNIALELSEMASIGEGSFVNVKDLTHAKTVLVSEIKKNSKKR